MMTSYLYDKDITVTLYRKERIVSKQRTYHISNINAYRKTRNSKNKQTITAWDNREGTRRITFHEGYYHLEKQANAKEGEPNYHLVIARGGLYTFRTIEAMTYGLRPDGNPFQTGDKIQVQEDRSKWHVIDESHIVSIGQNVVIEEMPIPEEKLVISSKESGLKPDITFSVGLLEGQNCYKAVLRVRNLNLGDVDIRLWDKMVITAGYRVGGNYCTFVCPIFTSYIESPNPDGITVFEGLTVGHVENNMYQRSVHIRFTGGTTTLRQLITECAKGIGPDVEVNIALGETDKNGYNDILDKEIKVPDNDAYAQNGLAVLNWLQATVSRICKEVWNISVLVHFLNGVVEVIGTTGTTGAIDENQVINMDMVTGATYSGVTLTVKAPWNPAMKPGSIFYMPPNFINASRLPNQIEASAYRGQKDYYRAITVNIAFGTVEDTNEMSVLALPAQYFNELSLKDTPTEMRAEDYAAARERDILETIDEADKENNIISIGGTPDSTKGGTQKETNIDLFDKTKNADLGMWNGGQDLKIDADRMGSCLSRISQFYCEEWLNGPKLLVGVDGSAKGTSNEHRYYRTKEALRNDNLIKALSHFSESGILAYILWVPVIATATYWKKQHDTGPNNWDNINLQDIDIIHQGKSLWIPNFPGWNAGVLKTNKDIWKYAYLDYKTKYPSYSIAWRAMYYYLGGEDELA